MHFPEALAFPLTYYCSFLFTYSFPFTFHALAHSHTLSHSHITPFPIHISRPLPGHIEKSLGIAIALPNGRKSQQRSKRSTKIVVFRFLVFLWREAVLRALLANCSLCWQVCSKFVTWRDTCPHPSNLVYVTCHTLCSWNSKYRHCTLPSVCSNSLFGCM